MINILCKKSTELLFTSLRLALLTALTSLQALKLFNHSPHNHLELSDPREPMLENCPMTGHISLTYLFEGPSESKTLII